MKRVAKVQERVDVRKLDWSVKISKAISARNTRDRFAAYKSSLATYLALKRKCGTARESTMSSTPI